MMTKLYPMFAMAVLAAGVCSAQADGKPEPKFFRMDFVVKELESGKAINSRSHTMTVSDEGTGGSIRAGNRVPVPSGTGGGYQFIDVGVNIDTRGVKQVQNQLMFYVVAEISGSADEKPGMPPIIRQTKWSSNVIVPLKKATTLFSSDDPGTKRQMQLELVVTPLQ